MNIKFKHKTELDTILLQSILDQFEPELKSNDIQKIVDTLIDTYETAKDDSVYNIFGIPLSMEDMFFSDDRWHDMYEQLSNRILESNADISSITWKVSGEDFTYVDYDAITAGYLLYLICDTTQTTKKISIRNRGLNAVFQALCRSTTFD